MMDLKIEDLKPGMTLARPVRNHQGVLLLEAGARITRKNIRIFKSWGVPEVAIKGKPGDSEDHPEVSESGVMESVETLLKEKFADVLDDPVMVEIHKSASKLLMREYQSNESDHEPA
jgi:hypothetical protein